MSRRIKERVINPRSVVDTPNITVKGFTIILKSSLKVLYLFSVKSSNQIWFRGIEWRRFSVLRVKYNYLQFGLIVPLSSKDSISKKNFSILTLEVIVIRYNFSVEKLTTLFLCREITSQYKIDIDSLNLSSLDVTLYPNYHFSDT